MTSYKRLLLIEDGSVDADELIKDMQDHNPEIKVILYRQGATAPQLLSLEEEHGIVTAIGFVTEENEEEDEL